MKTLLIGACALLIASAGCGRIAQTETELTRDAPPPAAGVQSVSMQQRPGFPNAGPGTPPVIAPDETPRPNGAGDQDSYHAAEDVYRYVLDKAAQDHKVAVANCHSLAVAARKNCIKEADAEFKVAKSEAHRLKPVS
jgi:hypothetical protein